MTRKVVNNYVKKKQTERHFRRHVGKVVKASGDECVTGYVRFRRIKKCEGYGKAKREQQDIYQRLKEEDYLTADIMLQL